MPLLLSFGTVTPARVSLPIYVTNPQETFMRKPVGAVSKASLHEIANLRQIPKSC